MERGVAVLEAKWFECGGENDEYGPVLFAKQGCYFGGDPFRNVSIETIIIIIIGETGGASIWFT